MRSSRITSSIFWKRLITTSRLIFFNGSHDGELVEHVKEWFHVHVFLEGMQLVFILHTAIHAVHVNFFLQDLMYKPRCCVVQYPEIDVNDMLQFLFNPRSDAQHVDRRAILSSSKHDAYVHVAKLVLVPRGVGSVKLGNQDLVDARKDPRYHVFQSFNRQDLVSGSPQREFTLASRKFPYVTLPINYMAGCLPELFMHLATSSSRVSKSGAWS